ncbi:MAG: hypothetical protein Crog4KO_33810 [Crocinitomicaceae bacterium]
MIIDAIGLKRLEDSRVSLLKTVSWRIIGTIDTMIISYLLTGKLDVAVSIGGIEVVSKMILYYLHERAWIKLLRRNQ